MTGFKKFILRGNLVELAVAVIMSLAFLAVVTTFTEWLTGLMPESVTEYFSTKEQSFGAFLNATVAFLITGVVVYFFVVLPYTKTRERYFPGEKVKPDDILLLEEIRDLLQAQNNRPLA